MVARTTHNKSALKIDSVGHGYQIHHAGCPRQQLLYVGMYQTAGKMLCPHILFPE